MIRNLLSSLLLTLIALTVNGQTIEISQVRGLSTSTICLGQKIVISYTTKGSFNANNTFSIQAKSSYYSTTWVNLDTKDSSGYLVASLTKDIYTTLMKDINYTDFRIVSTSPSVISNNYISQSVYTPATVEVLDIQKKILYPYETVAMSLNLSGSAPINVVTSDSTSFIIPWYDLSKYSLKVNPTKTEKYGISSVSNICGLGKASGGVDITVLNKMLKIVGISNNHICRNGKIEVRFVKTGNWDIDNKYILRLTESYQTVNSKKYDLNTTEENGILSANIPDNVPLSRYNIQVIESKSGIESSFFQTTIDIHYELKVDLLTESSSIIYGQSKQLAVAVSGYGTFSIELSDGQIINQPYVNDNSSNTYFDVSPKETTSYTIKSYTSTCGNGEGKNTVLLTVLKGIKTDSIKAGKYCEGSTCEVKFSSNGTIKVGSFVKVRFVSESYFLNPGNYNYVETLGTVVRENVASFIVPTNLSESINTTSWFLVNVYTDDMPSTSVSPNRVNILTFPSAKLYDSNDGNTILTKPETTNLGVFLKGGGYYTITLADGTKYFYEHNATWLELQTNIPVYVPQTSTIGIKSITNMCGTNNDIKVSKYVQVNNPEYSIKVSSNNLLNLDICAGSKLDLTLLTAGKFGDNNLFSVELIPEGPYVSSVNLGTIKAGTSSITIPSQVQSAGYYLKVSSNNPLLYSNILRIYVKAPPVITLNNYSTSNILAGERANIYQSISGGDTARVTYKDGSKVIYPIGNSSHAISMAPILTKTTTFGVQSISNICGVGSVSSKDITINVAPYAINNNLESYRLSNSYGFQCQQNKLVVPFDIRGNVDKNVSFSIQIAKYADTTFTTLLSGVKQSPAIVTIPDSFVSGNYSIRIVSSDNLVKSENSGLRLKTLLTSVLQLPDGKTETTINAGESITLSSKSNNADYYYNNFRYIIQDDSNRKTIGENEYAYIQETKYPTTNTTYSLISVINECGIGNASGTVKVTVKPVLNMKLNNNSSSNFCVGSSTSCTLNSVGTFANDNIFKVFIIDENDTRTELLSTPQNGVFNLVLGNSNFKRGYYKIQIVSSNPYQVKDLYTIFLSTTADVSLSGGAIINPGGVAALTIKNNDIYKSTNSNYYYSELLSFELSNGTSGEVYLNNSNTQTTFYVYPTTTQTYAIKSVKNVCGIGKADGTVTITVNPLSSKQTSIQNYFMTFCAGSSLDITFSSIGAFTSNNKFTVQLSDKTGGNFKDLTTVGNTSPLKIKIPLDLPSGDGYLFRVMASDSGVSSATNYIPYTALQGATARFDTSSYLFNENKPVAINIRFTGLPPFDFYIGSDEINAKRYTSSTNLYSITLNPLANSSYRLFSVINNTCGVGTIVSPSTVRLELVTGIDELSKLGIRVFPNPTSDIIKIESNDKELKIQLSDIMGKIFEDKMLYGEDKQLNISQLNAGIYLLQIQKDGRQATFKIIKL